MATGSHFVYSGSRGAYLSAMGMFSSNLGLIHLGAPAMVSTLGIAATAGFVGGLVMYPAAIAVRTLLCACGLLNTAHTRLVFSIDLLTWSLALPVGAWMLGLPVYSFFCAALVAASMYVLFSFIGSATQSYMTSRSQSQSVSDFFEEVNQGMFSNQILLANNTSAAITYSIGTFC